MFVVSYVHRTFPPPLSPPNPGIVMTKCDSLERSTGKYVQPLTYHVHHDDSQQALISKEDSGQYQSLQTKNMNYISIYSIPIESSSSRQVTPTSSLSEERKYANRTDVSLQQGQPRSGPRAPVEVDRRYQGNGYQRNRHQDKEDIPYTSLDLWRREHSQMYTTPHSNPANH